MSNLKKDGPGFVYQGSRWCAMQSNGDGNVRVSPSPLKQKFLNAPGLDCLYNIDFNDKLEKIDYFDITKVVQNA